MEIVGEIDINIAPSQGSLQHILYALDDFCIQEILRRLNNINDFLSAAEVCTRFQENAKACIPKRFKEIEICESQINTIPVKRMQSFLNIFGHLIESIKWFGLMKFDKIQDQNLFDMFEERCGKTLRTFRIWGHNVDFKNKKFQVLERFDLCSAGLHNFNLNSQLKRLFLKEVTVDHLNWLTQEFPKLEDATFKCIGGVTNELLTEFLTRNPQIRKLYLKSYNAQMTPSIFQQISNNASHLEQLIFVDRFRPQNNELDPMPGLHRLKNLFIWYDERKIRSRRISIRKLIDSFVENEVPIEKLSFRGVDSDSLKNLAKLKLIETLDLTNIPEFMLLNFVSNRPNLRTLAADKGFYTLQGIKDILRCGQNLTILQIRWLKRETILDVDAYNSILELTSNQLVRFDLHFIGNISVPEEVLEANRKRVHVIYI